MTERVHGELISVVGLIREFIREDAAGPEGSHKNWWSHLYKTNLQKWAFRFMAGALFFGIAALGPFFYWRTYWTRLAPVLFIFVAQLSACVYQLAIVLPDFWALISSPVRTFLTPCLDRADLDSARVGQLSRCPSWQLEFVENQLRLYMEHLKARLWFLLGAIEKVGVLPAIAASVGTLYSLRTTLMASVAEPWLQMGVVALTALYIMAILALFIIHRVEQYCLLLGMARKVKEKEMETSSI
jgi:hypothetical protein